MWLIFLFLIFFIEWRNEWLIWRAMRHNNDIFVYLSISSPKAITEQNVPKSDEYNKNMKSIKKK
jgi:hypothetical protein